MLGPIPLSVIVAMLASHTTSKLRLISPALFGMGGAKRRANSGRWLSDASEQVAFF